MTETPQLSVPEQQEGMIAPGQETLVEQIQEGESSIPEKFQNASREDVIKAYQELEKMKGQPQEAEAPGTPSSEEPAETTEEFSYTPEAAGEFYGKENVAALAEKGVAPGNLALFRKDRQRPTLLSVLLAPLQLLIRRAIL